MTDTFRHVFAPLGAAPYRYLGHETKTYQACHGAPIQPGATCDHGGTAISEVFNCRSADGKTFHVGSTCVEKSGDKGLKKVIAADVAKHRREMANTNADRKIDAALAVFPAVRDALSAKPHPTPYMAAQGRTLLDWCDWMMEHAGRSGKVKVARAILAVAS